eukprot:3814935-Amphidinium_carterae.1
MAKLNKPLPFNQCRMSSQRRKCPCGVCRRSGLYICAFLCKLSHHWSSVVLAGVCVSSRDTARLGSFGSGSGWNPKRIKAVHGIYWHRLSDTARADYNRRARALQFEREEKNTHQEDAARSQLHAARSGPHVKNTTRQSSMSIAQCKLTNHEFEKFCAAVFLRLVSLCFSMLDIASTHDRSRCSCCQYEPQNSPFGAALDAKRNGLQHCKGVSACMDIQHCSGDYGLDG